jgi:outer membrane protein X
MKKTLLTLCAAVIAVSSFAQNSDRIRKPFKFDLAVGLAVPAGSGTNIGFNFAFEPKYAVVENIAVGMRMEWLAAAHNYTVGNNSNDGQGDVTTLNSYLATGDYYFSNKAFRPFVGGGLGVFTTGTATYKSSDGNYYDYQIPSSTKFGGMIRAGFEVMHFRLGAEYNIAGNTNFTSPYTNGQLKNSYFALKVGAFIGGGKY